MTERTSPNTPRDGRVFTRCLPDNGTDYLRILCGSPHMLPPGFLESNDTSMVWEGDEDQPDLWQQRLKGHSAGDRLPPRPRGPGELLGYVMLQGYELTETPIEEIDGSARLITVIYRVIDGQYRLIDEIYSPPIQDNGSSPIS